MGTWGPAIFSDDLAADVRDEYRDHLGDGLTGPEATDRLLDAYADALADVEGAPVVWLALAATQARVGRLEDRVRDRALAIIDRGEDLHRWSENPRLIPQREAALRKLRSQLTAPQRAAVRVPRRRLSEWPFDNGALLAYRRTDERVVLFRVVGSTGDRGGRYGLLEPLDWSGSDAPSPDQIKGLRPRVPVDWTASSPTWIMLIAVGGAGLGRFSVVGSTDAAVARRTGTVVTTAQLDGLLDRRYGL